MNEPSYTLKFKAPVNGRYEYELFKQQQPISPSGYFDLNHQL